MKLLHVRLRSAAHAIDQGFEMMDRNEFSFDHVGNVTKILMLMKNLHNEEDMDV